MPTLTRRRDPDAREEAWLIFYGDVHVGTIGKRTEADFREYRRHRASHAWMRAMWDAGCRLPTQTADGLSQCFCGADIDMASMDEHIYAAHMGAVLDLQLRRP